jgi:hypothetical protein
LIKEKTQRLTGIPILPGLLKNCGRDKGKPLQSKGSLIFKDKSRILRLMENLSKTYRDKGLNQ